MATLFYPLKKVMKLQKFNYFVNFNFAFLSLFCNILDKIVHRNKVIDSFHNCMNYTNWANWAN